MAVVAGKHGHVIPRWVKYGFGTGLVADRVRAMLDDAPITSLPKLRPPSKVMRLRRMGAAFPTRLSFLRVLIRDLAADKVQVKRVIWQMSAQGYGHAVYSLRFRGHDYALVAVSTELAAEQRTDRVIAEAWDTAYVLYDGIPDAAEVARIVRDAPRQEAARYNARDLVLSRANKSVRLWDHVVKALQAGQQPDRDRIAKTGYLMRTTAVYGNGKFGIADRAAIADRPGLSGAFAAEMLTVWLIRGFTHDLVEHVGGGALDRDIKQHLGIGNATGLGMAPFLVNHPVLLDAWMRTRETAIARVRGIELLTPAQASRLYALIERVAQYLATWNVPDPTAAERIVVLRREWPELASLLTPDLLLAARPIDRVIAESENFSIDCQELVAALVLEPFGDLVDELAASMATSIQPQLDPAMSCDALSELLQRDWEWALRVNFDAPEDCAQFWYVSEEKLEPRLGDRHHEDGAERESPLDIARQVKSMAADLPDTGQVMAFLRQYPQHRAAVRRVQTLDHYPYAEIRDNLIGRGCLPVDMLRCKLAFFGASRFDPKSDRWTRITLAQGAPLADALNDPNVDDWWLSTPLQ